MRNLGNITAPRLYNRSFAGSKYLVEEYIAQVVGAVEDINVRPPATAAGGNETGSEYETQTLGISTQRKLDFLHDTRQAFGRTTLVLQGGAIFGLCHLGVVKALFLRGLLPRIITGTATGALIASLVAIHTEDELPSVLKGDGIDLSAFEAHAHQGQQTGKQSIEYGWQTLLRRIRRFMKEGYFLDVTVLEECVKANVGDLTFEEAYNRSKRVLNITVATEGQEGVPALLNYITAPNVVSISDIPLCVPVIPVPVLDTHTATVDLDSRRCFQRFDALALRKPRDDGPLQRRRWQDCSLGICQYLPPLHIIHADL